MDFFENLKRLNKEQRNAAYREFITEQQDCNTCYGHESGLRELQRIIDRSGIFDSRLKEKKEIWYESGMQESFNHIMMRVPLIAGQALFEYCKNLQTRMDDERANMVRELDEE